MLFGPYGVFGCSTSSGPWEKQISGIRFFSCIRWSDLCFSSPLQTRSIDPQCLERCGGRLVCGADVCVGMESFMGDFRGSCSPAECLGRTSIGPLSESDEECHEDDDEDDEGEEEAEEREAAAQQTVFERDCTELDLNLIEEN